EESVSAGFGTNCNRAFRVTQLTTILKRTKKTSRPSATWTRRPLPRSNWRKKILSWTSSLDCQSRNGLKDLCTICATRITTVSGANSSILMTRWMDVRELQRMSMA
ncbi:hypothetical protein LTS18_010161, partial [Coniosporium uncinatum]